MALTPRNSVEKQAITVETLIVPGVVGAETLGAKHTVEDANTQIEIHNGIVERGNFRTDPVYRAGYLLIMWDTADTYLAISEAHINHMKQRYQEMLLDETNVIVQHAFDSAVDGVANSNRMLINIEKVFFGYTEPESTND